MRLNNKEAWRAAKRKNGHHQVKTNYNTWAIVIYEARLLKGPDLADAENPQRFLKHWLNVLKKKKKKFNK